MDQFETQINEQGAAAGAAETQSPTAPVKRAPRVRRAASSPAGAPTKVPAAETAGDTPAPEASAAPAAAAPADTAAEAPRRRATRARKAPVAAPESPVEAPLDAAGDTAAIETVAKDTTGTNATGSDTTASDTAAAAEPAPKAKATRTRRRAATAEAGPAAPAPEVPFGEPAAAEAAVAAAAVAGDTANAADDGAAAGVGQESPAAEKPVRARRTVRTRRMKSDAVEAVEVPADGEEAEEASDGSADDAGTEAPAAAAQRPDATQAGKTGPGTAETAAESAPKSAEPSYVDPFAVPDSPLSLLFHAPDLSAAVQAVKVTEPALEDDEDDDTEDSGPRRRRSRRRGRNRSDNGTGDVQDDETGDSAEGQSNGPSSEAGDAVTSRRRRRRRRGDQDLELTGGEDDDPPNTVTRVRAPRQSNDVPSDRVTSVKGSTRLEAKKQRRRESRDSGRRRQVITEAEFLARRESVDRQMVVRQRDDRIQIGVLEDGILAEHFVSKTQQDSLIGNVYLGKVQNVLPSMEAAFVDIGRGRNAVLYAGEVNWDAAGLDGQPRRIELALKSGDPVLVQVTKDPVGHKGARLTSQISLPGRYLVYVPGGSMTGISRKLPDVERNRLKRILKDRLPENAGVIVRTAAEGASEEELTHDINRLRAQWEEIERKSSSTKTLAPELLYGEPDLTIKVVRDVFNEDFSKLLVSGEEAWDTIEAYVMYVAPDLVGRLEKWTSEEDIFTASRIDEQIQKALDRKVYLPSGGSLVIDRTEAMTVVDVNTGKFTGSGGNLEETVTKNNLEAAEEVVRQLRLRDIGGIIVIDFIDMVLEANRDLVLRRLVECLGRDRTKHQVAEVTSLGLVQMTRKRMGTGLLEVFGEVCEHCAGRGVVTHDEPVEHRRHAVSTENHQQHLRQEKMSRSERKRSRGRTPEPVEEPQAAPEPRTENPERAAKAEAARAALASIAAATHHAAHSEEALAVAPEKAPAPETAPATERSRAEAAAAVLTINGETVTLPRAEAAAAAAAPEGPRLTLDSLAEAFDKKPAGGRGAGAAEAPARDAVQPSEAAAQASAPAAPAAQSAPAAQGSRRRPRRRAASAQGSNASIETVTASGAGEAQPGAQHVARAGKPAPREDTGGDEPMILGVGVPASDL
ncbi:ribonuclease E/G [Arthrobacter sp. MSA 4-2]|uniref:Rne/Rng family ribonuclease n=1 Tax=Arthrobacter sp. MSA 4-2 TaxID=2794349 RepID=UPI0018E81C18|nr:Rne/Rng family ribonuclease [Arthrobacter sp. MSA 4-2]MBJ2122329.1 ribonuclease E/G [Arthrobacter sp. MSA 4-2]